MTWSGSKDQGAERAHREWQSARRVTRFTRSSCASGGLGVASDGARLCSPACHPSSVVRRLGRNIVLPMHRICAGSTEIMKELVATPLQL